MLAILFIMRSYMCIAMHSAFNVAMYSFSISQIDCLILKMSVDQTKVHVYFILFHSILFHSIPHSIIYSIPTYVQKLPIKPLISLILIGYGKKDLVCNYNLRKQLLNFFSVVCCFQYTICSYIIQQPFYVIGIAKSDQNVTTEIPYSIATLKHYLYTVRKQRETTRSAFPHSFLLTLQIHERPTH